MSLRKPKQLGKLGAIAYKYQTISKGCPVLEGSARAGQFTVMPCPFTGRKIFCAGPNFLCRTKHLFTYCASHKHFVPDKKMICIQ